MPYCKTGLNFICVFQGCEASADVVVTLADRMVTLQEVRAVKGSLVSDDD